MVYRLHRIIIKLNLIKPPVYRSQTYMSVFVCCGDQTRDIRAVPNAILRIKAVTQIRILRLIQSQKLC